jgi:hypothetical protein
MWLGGLGLGGLRVTLRLSLGVGLGLGRNRSAHCGGDRQRDHMFEHRTPWRLNGELVRQQP